MILGISFCGEQIIVKSNEDTDCQTYPLILCKIPNDTFEIGIDAYEQSLVNGILIDKIIEKSKQAKEFIIDGVSYETSRLFEIFFKNLFVKYGNIEFVCVCVEDNNTNLLNDLDLCLYHILDDKNKYILTTNSDSFLKYVMNLDEKILDGKIGLINFSDKSLIYYELNKVKFSDYEKPFIEVRQTMHEPLPIDLLSENNEIRVIDNFLSEFAKKVISNNQYSCFFISGSGFKEQELYRDFINLICKQDCQILKEENLFVYGAELFANQNINGIIDNKYYYITDNRTNFAISIYDEDTNVSKLICDFGTVWFLNKISFQIIVFNTDRLTFIVDKYGGETIKENILLNNDFIIRDNKTTKLLVSVSFSQSNIINITVQDTGFGEFYAPIENAKSYRDIEV